VVQCGDKVRLSGAIVVVMQLKFGPIALPVGGALLVLGSACVVDPGADDKLGNLPPRETGGAATSSAAGSSVTSGAGTSSAGTSSPGGGSGSVLPGNGGSAPVGQGGAAGGGSNAVAGSGGSGGGSTAGASGDPLAQGGPSKCPLAGSQLCDGFETAAPGDATSLFKLELGSGSTGVVDGTKVFRGAKSVHLKTTSAQAFITETATFTGTTAASNNETWGRLFIWFETKANPQSHDVFIRLEDPGSTLSSAQFHLAGGSRGELAAEIRSGSDLYKPKIVEPAPAGTVLFPLATPKWQCWEWHTTPSNTLEFYIDGELYAPMSVTAADKWPFPIFKKLYLGFMQFGTTPATELWLDEVALSDKRVGCGN
jgi:hypothetical protein